MVTDSIDWTYIFLFFSLRTEKKKSVLERSTATTSSCQLTLSHGKSASDLEFKCQLKPTWVCVGGPFPFTFSQLSTGDSFKITGSSAESSVGT